MSHTGNDLWPDPPEKAPAPQTSEQRASLIEQAKALAAEAAEHDGARCTYGEKVFWLPSDRAYAPGQIYTMDGKAEFEISRCCEYHFDKMFDEAWKEPSA